MTERYRAITLDIVSQGEIVPSGRMNPGFFEDHYLEVERRLTELGAVPLGTFIPDEHADGSKGITYGQVGARHLNPDGDVRYLQVINIRDTGIDFAIKPDRVAAGSHNDPDRSRVIKHDILFTNTAFRGTETLLGRCVVVTKDFGTLNISQDIDRIRPAGISPYYIAIFLKSKYGKRQIDRVVHGVDSQKINFGRIRALLIPHHSNAIQKQVESQYLAMSRYHDRAMSLKERLLVESDIEPGRYGEEINSLAEEKPAYNRAMREAKERLDHLVAQLESVIEGRQKKIEPFPE